MDLDVELKTFYESILDSFEKRAFYFEPEQTIQALKAKKTFDEEILSYTQIMISSWIECLQGLFGNNSTEALLIHLNNHISFLKRVNSTQQANHQQYFKRICDKLINYLLSESVNLTRNLESEEEYNNYEFNMYLFNKELELEELILYILKRSSPEINSTSEEHIRNIMRALKEGNVHDFKLQLNQLKAIQETIHTILQLDKKDKPNPLIRRLHKEYETINNFYIFLKQVLENNTKKTFSIDEFDFKTSQDYPFLDTIKNISKWYQTRNDKYLENAQDLIAYINSLKPYREQDKQYLSSIKLLYQLTKEFQFYITTDLSFPLEYFLSFLGNADNNWHLNMLVLRFLQDFCDYYDHLNREVNSCFHFLFKMCINSEITLLYRRKLFQSVVLILQDFLKSQFISLSRARKYVLILKQVSQRLKGQTLKKMGNFKEVSYRLTSDFHLDEFEKGIVMQLLYGLDDFSEWIEGKHLREILINSECKSTSRFQILENLFKIGLDVSTYDYSIEKDDELQKIESNMVRTYFSTIISDHFRALSLFFKEIYSILIIHMINLVYDAGRISNDDREYLVNELVEAYNKDLNSKELQMAKFTRDTLFSEEYEKTLANAISLLHLYLPTCNL